MLDAAIDAIRGGVNQYPPGLGDAGAARGDRRPPARASTASSSTPTPRSLVTAGATEALAGALLGMLDAGDEVVVFEPMYDSYQACIALAGAVAVPGAAAPARPTARIASTPTSCVRAITPRTKLILLNTPHNPTGKVFDADELAVIADLAIEHDLIVVDRRGLRAPRLRRPPPRPDRHAARHGASAR